MLDIIGLEKRERPDVVLMVNGGLWQEVDFIKQVKGEKLE